jgi:hypothetical protein
VKPKKRVCARTVVISMADRQAPAKKSKKTVKEESDLSEEEKPKKKVNVAVVTWCELIADARQARQEGAGRRGVGPV